MKFNQQGAIIGIKMFTLLYTVRFKAVYFYVETHVEDKNVVIYLHYSKGSQLCKTPLTRLLQEPKYLLQVCALAFLTFFLKKVTVFGLTS